MRRVILLLGLVGMLPCAVAAQAERPLTSADSIALPLPQNTPCDGQARTYLAFRREYRAARSTAREPLVGTWALIGHFFVSSQDNTDQSLLNCAALRNGPGFAQVLIVAPDSVSNESLWNLRWWPDHAYEPRTRDAQGNLTFLAESGGDYFETYHCRLSTRGTLLCLETALPYGLEFRRMIVPAKLRPGVYWRDPTR